MSGTIIVVKASLETMPKMGTDTAIVNSKALLAMLNETAAKGGRK